MNEAYLHYDHETRTYVLRQGESRQEFTPEQWRVLCMAVNTVLSNSVWDLQHLLKFRNSRIEEMRGELELLKAKLGGA
ncbi:hypothetical protein ACUY4Q_003683 [Phytobacter sp. AG2a]